MSQENVEIVRAGYEEWSRSGSPPLELLDPSFTTYDPPEVPDSRIYHGRHGLLEQLQNVEQAFDELRWEADDFIEADDKILVATRMIGRGKESAAEVSMHVFHVWTFRSGSAVELRTLITREQAFQAVGLSE
jgi:ketosteroid isomerase-like protein